MQSADILKQNIEKLAKIFPSCVSEGKVNFEALKQLFSDKIIDGDESYNFTWVGKKAAVVEAHTPIRKTLRPCVEESMNWDKTENLYIEGDNLEALTALSYTHEGKIDVIYIDPPYNTGNKDFVYNDSYVDSEDSYRHSKWLSFMEKRLKIAKTLLSDKGVIFISIDDNEQANLKLLCDEVFGESNSQALVTYVRKTSGKQDSSNFMKSTEYIVVYSKTDKWDCQPLVADSHVTDRYNKTDDDGRAFRETDLRKTGNADRREARPLMYYPFYYNPNNNELIPSSDERQDLKLKGYIEIFPIKPSQFPAVCSIQQNNRHIIALFLQPTSQRVGRFLRTVADDDRQENKNFIARIFVFSIHVSFLHRRKDSIFNHSLTAKQKCARI